MPQKEKPSDSMIVRPAAATCRWLAAAASEVEGGQCEDQGDQEADEGQHEAFVDQDA